MISDEELRRRLKAHNYVSPPITDTTRKILVKKLRELESHSKAVEKLNNNRRVITNGSRHVDGDDDGRGLMDYSSADDEALENDDSFRKPARRQVVIVKRRVSSSSSRSGNKRNSRSGSPKTSRSSRSSLMRHSETEEDSEDEKEEEEEEDESDYDDDDEEEEEISFRRNNDLGIQTSPGLDDTDSKLSDLRYRGGGISSGRFASSTPINNSPIRPTASYLNPAASSSPRTASILPRFSSPVQTNHEFSSLSSPTLRKQIAKNSNAFGSLGEVLSTLPRNSNNSPPSEDSTCGSLNSSSSSSSNGSAIVTQSASQHDRKAFKPSKQSTFCNSHTISKIIVILAGAFFFLLAFKYSNLRPHPDISHRIVVCGEDIDSSVVDCVPPDEIDSLIALYKDVVFILERKCVDRLCEVTKEAEMNEESSEVDVVKEDREEEVKDKPTFVTYDELLQKLLKLRNETDEETFDDVLLRRLLKLLQRNPQWGVVVSEDESDISLQTHPPLDWGCWLSLKIGFTYALLCAASLWGLKMAVIGASVYGLYKWRIWYKERKLREHQDVFELVEHVLSILATQNALVAREGGRSSPSYVAIDHIRDQLISPQDRGKKKRLWDKVVKYVRESESRVREDVRNIYGEETKVWQWIPDIRWGQHGPNPYVPVGVSNAPVLNASSPAPSPGPPQWQGSAFNSLNKNVAAPQVAPTTCLKVRHMFDQQTARGDPNGWVWRVKEEILRRCSGSASILHVAVDKQSPEGCVYIKAADPESAGNVFKCLHGQWYRGNLVTVKYLREERYCERFMDAKNARTPLTPQT